ncbi:MAG: NAD-dependent epimerase/dehydratase family protein, partial [Leadbetterella sp.]
MNICITGGTGMIGIELAKKLSSEGHIVRILSRSAQDLSFAQCFVWDYKEKYIQEGALDGVEVLVHLAGSGIVDKSWTETRKKDIVDSRVESLRFLGEVLPTSVHSLVSGSAVGFFGGDRGH